MAERSHRISPSPELDKSNVNTTDKSNSTPVSVQIQPKFVIVNVALLYVSYFFFLGLRCLGNASTLI